MISDTLRATSRKSVLIIDDDESSRIALKHIFEYLNYSVYEACDGKEGIESYRRITTDIVITDIYMPVKDGLETIRELKKEFPEARIIAMSGIDTNTMDYLRARDFGAMRCIWKPVEVEDIVKIVQLTLDGDAVE